MIALVTGASSGIGRDISLILAKKGYDIIAVARDKKRLDKLKKDIEKVDSKRKVYIEICDLTDRKKVIKLHDETIEKFGKLDILVNNAGFGLAGEFDKTDLDKELAMIDTNIVALEILTKLFLKDMIKKDSGKILNVASIAAFEAGPKMATYYATKNYVLRLSQAIRWELIMKNSRVQISVLCPGPVETNFNKTASVKFFLLEENSMLVANKAVNDMLRGKFMIYPSIISLLVRIFAKICPDDLMALICSLFQKKS